MGSTFVPSAAAFAAGVLVGLLVATTCSSPGIVDPAEGRTHLARDDAPGEAPRPRDPRPRARAAAGAAETAEANPFPAGAAIVLPPRAAGDPEVREIAVPDAPAGWATLEVEVVDADGKPLPGEYIAAFRRGMTYDIDRDDNELVAQRETEADGLARLTVASPGRYVVMTHGAPFHLTRDDVAVPETKRVTLRDPGRAEIRVTAADEVPEGENLVVTAFAKEGASVSFSGTVVTAAPRAGWNCTLTPAAPSGVIAIPPGMPWRLGAEGTWVCEPSEVVAPAEVRVRRREREHLVVLAALHGESAPVPYDRRVVVEFDGGSGGQEEWFSLPPGEPTEGRCMELRVTVPAAKGVLRWSGAEVEPGSVPFDLARERTIPVDVQERPADLTAVPARVVVPGETDPDEGGVSARLFDPRDPDLQPTVNLDLGVEVRLPATGAWIVLPPQHGGRGADHDIVAGPARLTRGARIELRPRRGGFVVVVPRRRPPRDAGKLEIVRADGGPLVVSSEEGDPDVLARTEIGGGILLGPFEPGPVVLDVMIARVRWQRLEVIVRAGETVALPVGPFGEETER